MRLVRYVAAAVVLLAGGVEVSRQFRSSEPPQRAIPQAKLPDAFLKMPFHLKVGKIILGCQIGDYKGTAMLDTGATDVFWDAPKKWYTKPTARKSLATGIGDGWEGQFREARLPPLKLGNRVFNGLIGSERVFERGSTIAHSPGFDSDIILGNPFWKEFQVLIDYEKRELTLYSAQTRLPITRLMPRAIKLSVIMGREAKKDTTREDFFISLEVEGQPAKVLLDTGYAFPKFDPDFIKRLPENGRRIDFAVGGYPAGEEVRMIPRLPWRVGNQKGTFAVMAQKISTSQSRQNSKRVGIVSPLSMGVTKMLIDYPSQSLYLEFEQ